MDSVGALIAAVLVAIGLLAGIGVVHYSLSNSGSHHTYTESFDPSAGTEVSFNESNRDGVYYASTVNVTDENQSIMRPGIDYTWHESNGTLTVLDGGDLENDSTASIDYGLRIPSEQQKTYATLLGDGINIAYAVPLVIAAAVVLIGAAVLRGLS